MIRFTPGQRMRVALVGAGGWGQHHARVYSEREDVDFCAVVGRDAARTQAHAAKLGVRAYTDLGAMLDAEQPDLVSLALPNLDHYAPTMQVIQAGVPLIVEKPLVFDLREADALLDEAAKRGLFFAVVFNHRYARPVQMAKQAVESNQTGDITYAMWHWAGNWEPNHPHMALIESHCHGFDMLEYLCGPIASVSCEMSDKTGFGFRSVALALRFNSGAVGSMVGGYDSSFAYKPQHLLEINGTAGRVLVEDTVQKYTFQERGAETRTVWEAGFFNDRDRSFDQTMNRYFDTTLDAFRRGEAPPVHATAGRRALQLALAAIESFESGKRMATFPI